MESASINQHNEFKGSYINGKINLNSASIQDIMSLDNIDTQIAHDILDFAKDTVITDTHDLLELESIDTNMLSSWNILIGDMRVNLNQINEINLQKVKGIGKILAKKILAKKNELGSFTNINQLRDIDNLKKEAFENIKLRFKL